MNILLLVVQDGHHYRNFLVPSTELEGFDLDEIDDVYLDWTYYYNHDHQWESNKEKEVKRLWTRIDSGYYNDYENPKKINADRIVLIGSAG
jgi:hypothetical protein